MNLIRFFLNILYFFLDLDWFNVSEHLSLKRDLNGKVVVLDFFTYCCINCMHILPDLKKIEERYSIENGLVVIGVHSAKFDNEKDSSNIQSAIQRYNITHPVVNDSSLSLWLTLHIKCWPTLLVLGPRGNPIFILMGEGHGQILDKYIKATLQFYRNANSLTTHAIALNPNESSQQLLKASILKFPGKIACKQLSRTRDNSDAASPDSELYVVSDSGNNRILIFQSNGQILEVIGGKEIGFADGNFKEARFNSPQGVSFYGNDIIYVADTENHAIREINLTTKTVDTIAGHGKQGVDQAGGLIGTSQEISSPWDVITYRTRDMDMSFHVDEESIPERDIILIAMAGTHQLWAIFKDETIWWKFKKFAEGAVAAIAGNGHEENRNNSYPQNAAFAQPSGLALAAKSKELFIADSESSCIRKLSLADGKVTAVAGGDRNPLVTNELCFKIWNVFKIEGFFVFFCFLLQNLFAFGDVDDTGVNAKFQHPLGVAYASKTHSLYVADTYNHKIKCINLTTNKVNTCQFKLNDGTLAKFNEPAGLCISPCDENRLYVCNTNSHSIDIINLSTSIVEPLKLFFGDHEINAKIRLNTLKTSKLLVSTGGAKVNLEINLCPKTGIKFTDAPQKWHLDPLNDGWHVIGVSSGMVCIDKRNDIDKDKPNDQQSSTATVTIDLKASKVLGGHPGDDSITIIFKLSLCAAAKGICFPNNFKTTIPIEYSADGMTIIDKKINVTIDEQNIELI